MLSSGTLSGVFWFKVDINTALVRGPGALDWDVEEGATILVGAHEREWREEKKEGRRE